MDMLLWDLQSGYKLIQQCQLVANKQIDSDDQNLSLIKKPESEIKIQIDDTSYFQQLHEICGNATIYEGSNPSRAIIPRSQLLDRMVNFNNLAPSVFMLTNEQQQRGLDDFSVATVARLGHKRGVPKGQSIRNKSGESYRALLKSFEDLSPNKKPRLMARAEDDWIEEIENPKHKLLTRIQASELAAANRKLREFVPPGTRIDVRDYQNDNIDTGNLFTELERRALEYLISEQFLSKCQFSISNMVKSLIATTPLFSKLPP